MSSTIQTLQIRLRSMGVSRLGLLGAMITTGVSANAVVPLVAQEELLRILGTAGHYQRFLDAVTWMALPFLLGSFSLLKHRRNHHVSSIGFAVIGLLNMCLYLTHLQWHPLLLRCLIGVAFGLTIPMGQFSLAAADLDAHERVKQFTMMLNLVAAGLTIIPFIGIAILWISNGEASLLFLFLALLSGILSLLSHLWIPRDAKIQQLRIASLQVTRHEGLTIAGDGLVIICTRSMYAFVLIWLSASIANYGDLQAASLCFTLPFVAWGFIAIPIISKLKPITSYTCFLVFPLATLAFSMMTTDAHWLPVSLIVISLLSIPEAFTPGQMISQWQSPSGRQFGNVVTLALMTICLSIGPTIYSFVNHMGRSWPLVEDGIMVNQALWFSLVPLPVCLLILVSFWRHYLIPPLRRR